MGPLTRAAWLAAGFAAALLAAWLLRPSGPPPSVTTTPPAPGGPILLLGDRGTSSGLDAYLAEMLRTEGWTAFSALDVAELSSSAVASERLVILPWTTRVDATAADTLDAFVRAGGGLISLGVRPALQMASGVSASSGRWRLVDLPLYDDTGEARATVQVFGETTGLAPGPDVEVIARFVEAPGGTPGPAAVATHRYGNGWVTTFGFDPATTIVSLRQGDPAWRGEERDGAPGPRATDAFVGWTNLSLAERPQADDHLRLLTAVITSMLADRGGLPRLWYFPAAEPALLVTTGDAHATSTSAIQAGLDLVEQAGGRMSVYYEPPAATGRLRRVARRVWHDLRARWSASLDATPTSSQVFAWRARGHEFAPHPVVTHDAVETSYRTAIQAFNDEGLGGRWSTTRTHAVYWQGWVASARIEQQAGIGLTLDYYQTGPWLKRATGQWLHTPFTGTGLPMRLIDERGTLLGIRQLTTTMADEQLLASAYDGWEGLDVEAASAVSSAVLMRAVGTHSVPVLQFHLDFLESAHPLRATVTQWVSTALGVATAQQIPVWSAARLLAFERCREQTRVVSVDWPSPSNLRFSVEQSLPMACSVTIELPPGRSARESAPVVTVTIDGTASSTALVRHNRRQLLRLTPGAHAVDVRFALTDRSSPQEASRRP